ncbi:hypothetical protein DL93DRAFT_2087053 [Clavulina sp. PMI_390]|nr:hypothetical protein DL93DRAFT_2087053 [Clavulina sp. PMI_390]
MSPLLLYRPPSRTGPSSSPQVSALTIETRAAREKRNEGRDGGAGSSGGGGNSSGRSGDGGGGESRYRHTRQESGGSMTSVPRLLAQPRSRFSHPSGAGPAAVHSNGHAPGATPGVNGHGLLVKRTSSGRGRHDAHLYRGDHESEYSYETSELGGDRSAAASPAPAQAPSRYRHYRGESDAAPLVPPPSKDSRGLSSPAPPASTLPPRVGRFGHPDAKSYTIAQSKGAPTRTAQPGHALLRIKKGVGMILVYPDDHWCDNCDNTGYVAYRPEQPCRFCWPKFAVPLTGSPHGDLRQYQWGALNYDKHNFQRPIPRFFIRRANASGPDTAVVPLDLARVVPSHLTLNHWPGSRAVARREDMEALERTFNPTQAWPPEGDRDCYEDRGAQRKGSSSPSSSSSSPSPSPSSNRVARILLRILTIGILGRGEGGSGGGTRGNELPPEGVWCFAPGDPRIGGELCRVCQGVGARGTALFVQKCDTCAGVGRRLDVYDRAALDPLPDDLYDE